MRDAAAEGDVAGIIRIQDVADELAEVHAELLEEGEGRGVAVPGGNGRRLAVPSPPLEELLAAVILDHGAPVGQAAKLSGTAVGAAEESPAIHDAESGTRAEGDADQYFRLGVFGVGPVRRHREAVGVVADGDRHSETLLQVILERNDFPGRDVSGIIHHSGMGVHQRRDSDSNFGGVRGDDTADLFREILEGLLHGIFLLEGRD